MKGCKCNTPRLNINRHYLKTRRMTSSLARFYHVNLQHVRGTILQTEDRGGTSGVHARRVEAGVQTSKLREICGVERPARPCWR